MKSMTSNEARNKAQKYMRVIFDECGFADGLNEECCGKITGEKFTYWYNKNRDGAVGNYIVYEVTASDVALRVDDIILSRTAEVYIDVFTVNSFESKKTNEMLKNLEEGFDKHNWQYVRNEDVYEYDTKLYHVNYFCTKIITNCEV